MVKNRFIAVDFDRTAFELKDQFSRDVVCCADADIVHLIEKSTIVAQSHSTLVLRSTTSRCQRHDWNYSDQGGLPIQGVGPAL